MRLHFFCKCPPKSVLIGSSHRNTKEWSVTRLYMPFEGKALLRPTPIHKLLRFSKLQLTNYFKPPILQAIFLRSIAMDFLIISTINSLPHPWSIQWIFVPLIYLLLLFPDFLLLSISFLNQYLKISAIKFVLDP